MTQTDRDQLVETLRHTMVTLVARSEFDLSARQLGVFLTCYLSDKPPTVRGLAEQLNHEDAEDCPHDAPVENLAGRSSCHPEDPLVTQ